MASPLYYISTRGEASALNFADVLLAGLASDGGLYVPESWPSLSEVASANPADTRAPSLSYPAFAAEVMWPFVTGTWQQSDFTALITDAYSTFNHPEVAPLVPLGDPDLSLIHI